MDPSTSFQSHGRRGPREDPCCAGVRGAGDWDRTGIANLPGWAGGDAVVRMSPLGTCDPTFHDQRTAMGARKSLRTRGGPGGDQAGANMLMCLLGSAAVRLDVWGGNHGGTKSSGVGR
jgi:hypothetical protein